MTNNVGYGILDDDRFYGYSHFGTFKNNTFTSNSLSALNISPAEIGSLDATSTYVNNGQKYIELRSDAASPAYAMTMNKLDANFRITSEISLYYNLTITPGSIIEFAADAGFSSGGGYDVSIIANGTAGNPIKFNGYLSNMKGLWQGLNLEGTNEQTVFNYCVIDGAGSTDSGECMGYVKAAVTLGADGCGDPGRGTITNTTISNSAGYAITYKSGDLITVLGNTYSGNTLGGVFLQ